MDVSSTSKKFLLACGMASALLCDDACGMKRFERPEVEVVVEAKVLAVVDVAINSENKKVMLLGADGLKAPKEDRQISVRYNRSMRGVAKIESTFEANGSDVNNNDVITYSVDFYPNKDSDEFSTIDKDNAESAVCYLSAAEEGYFIFRIEDEETDWQIDTYTGSAKITFVPTE